MEFLWPALGICVIVGFVFFILAQHWQRVLRRQAWTIRQLSRRVQELEDVEDPRFRQRLEESAPVPLEQVFTLTFHLNDRFWRNTLRISEENSKFIQTFGSFVGSVKLERWRSHEVATITEVLPASKGARWQTRSLDFYADAGSASDSLTLWELRLRRPNGPAERPPSLELVLRRDCVELHGHMGAGLGSASGSGNGDRGEHEENEIVFFRVPLDRALLAEFRSSDPLSGAKHDGGNAAANAMDANGSSWQSFYSHQDEALGIEWQLCLRDLCRKAEWEHWKTLETVAGPPGRDDA